MAKVFVSSVINAPAERVWNTLRDFNGLPEWHPGIRDSEIEGGLAGDSVGCVRSFHLQNGDALREQLTALSDQDRRMDYVILNSPMPVSNYLATLRVLPVTDADASYVAWSAEFHVTAENADEMTDLVANGVFQSGLDGLKEVFGHP